MSVQTSIYLDGFSEFRRKIERAPAALEKDLRRRAAQIAVPLSKKIKAAQSASGERQVSSRMAPTTKATSKGGLPAVVSGAGVPFAMGAEYGGQRNYGYTSQPVYGRRPAGPYKKHKTKQFRPHRGRDGHEFWGTIRQVGTQTMVESYSRAFDRAMQRVGLI